MKYYIYVIVSFEGHRYIGCTENIEKRLWQHNNKKAGWTKRGTNWRLVYSEEHESLSSARKRENWLKSGHGRAYLDEQLKKNGS